jgi:dihydropteroate synthase
MDEKTKKFIEEYRESMEDYEPDAEHMYEMRAAFGEGVEVVNIITGKKYKT